MIQGSNISDNKEYFEYRIKSGDTLSSIVFRMFGYASSDTRYKKTVDHLLALNPQIKNINFIKTGDMLRLGVLPPVISSSKQVAQIPIKSRAVVPSDNFVMSHVPAKDADNFWALSWLAQNSNYLTIPGGVALGTKGNLLSPANIALLTQINDDYAKYKTGNITKGQYDYLRKTSLDKLKSNVGPFEKWMFGQKTTHEAIRIARGGGVPANANIVKHADRLNKLASLGKAGGYVLVGVGLTASCMQIANTQDRHEKNEIFVETVASTGVGLGLGVVVGLFLISNPIGWGTALVLATGSAAISYASGKSARGAYNLVGGKVDLVSGSGVDSVCR